MRKITAGAVGIASAAVGLMAGYPLLARRKCLTWGASADEVARAMPGDGLLGAPDVVTTRAITVAADPERIWPWLVQLGPGRGGAYTYDWIENLFGLNMHSADRILPEFQHLAVGDVMPMGDDGPRMRVAILDPGGHSLVFASEDHHWTWAFGLYPTTGGTRLVSRNRISTEGMSWPARLGFTMVMEPGSLVMEAKMLQGIKARAERLQAAAVTNSLETREEGPYPDTVSPSTPGV
ncbi:hypothetical protein [Nocardia crassostreae]|uniref:hypothetical protein n=1 Tax=Nocardia crassostreae TaxID=53428 RepID=UPI000834A78A|nr:hypothetical protein [Nocardia crassostreae]